MPSTQTRTKLKAFQFIGGTPTEVAKEREAEKENLSVAPGKALAGDTTAKTAQAARSVLKAAVTPRPATFKTCPPPSTPAMKRLPLADLVGNIDDSSRHAPQPIVSPEEQLIWRGSQPVGTPLPRKNKKRARSSSPVGPSQDEHALDARKELTTPQADPAMEMWSRYTSNKGTPSANKSVAFAHLINESSPRSTAAAGSVNGLRRWASCGHEFPTSTKKRRRTHGVFQAEKDSTEDVFAAAPSSDSAMAGPPAKSNLANMIQQMKQCVPKSQSRVSSQLPSSSSPLPDTGDRHEESSGSPLPRRTQEQGTGTSETMEREDDIIEEDTYLEDNEPQRPAGSSDEFDDDDFDSDMADALDVNPQTHEQSAQAGQITSYVAVPPKPVHTLHPQQLHTGVQSRQMDSDDEFGMDEDEDGFAADLEHVASLFDTRPFVSPSQKAEARAFTGKSAPASVIDLDDDDSDEFGDDIDVDVFNAAEVAATQTSTNTVRRTCTFP
ncbi:hypothetical protein GQ44DRAFT_703433 [Phaeosphaeriaceae sp. PMI808]|nr:hypothetical protein GQ44DRAFT_703433 [Phaeosphaeriaceae sp. PMI808]